MCWQRTSFLTQNQSVHPISERQIPLQLILGIKSPVLTVCFCFQDILAKLMQSTAPYRHAAACYLLCPTDMSHIRDLHTSAARRLLTPSHSHLTWQLHLQPYVRAPQGWYFQKEQLLCISFFKRKALWAAVLHAFFQYWCPLLKAVAFTVTLLATQLPILQLRIAGTSPVAGG